MTALLEARELTKRFGGLTAVDRASLTVEEGTITALIGPNGAGKSTFFKMLAGEIEPTEGAVTFRGRPITGLGVARVCRLGIGKSHQITQIFPNLTVTENVVIPALAARRGSFRADVFGSIRRVDGLAELVARTLAEIGLAIVPACARASWRTARSGVSRSGLRSRRSRNCCCSTNPRPV